MATTRAISWWAKIEDGKLCIKPLHLKVTETFVIYAEPWDLASYGVASALNAAKAHDRACHASPTLERKYAGSVVDNLFYPIATLCMNCLDRYGFEYIPN